MRKFKKKTKSSDVLKFSFTETLIKSLVINLYPCGTILGVFVNVVSSNTLSSVCKLSSHNYKCSC